MSLANDIFERSVLFDEFRDRLLSTLRPIWGSTRTMVEIGGDCLARLVEKVTRDSCWFPHPTAQRKFCEVLERGNDIESKAR